MRDRCRENHQQHSTGDRFARVHVCRNRRAALQGNSAHWSIYDRLISPTDLHLGNSAH